MIRVWRLCRDKFVSTAFDGEAARLYPGRWNLRGTRMVYTAGSLALAALEMLVHFDADDAPGDYSAIPVDVPNGLHIEHLGPGRLPRNWRSTPAPEVLANLGSKFVESSRGAVLRVPSAVVPQESNYLLNPSHPDFHRLRILAPAPFVFDPRLTE